MQQSWSSSEPAFVESILLYWAETWTMKKEFQDRLDGNIHQASYEGTEHLMALAQDQTTDLRRYSTNLCYCCSPKSRLCWTLLSCQRPGHTIIGDCRALIEDLDHSTTLTWSVETQSLKLWTFQTWWWINTSGMTLWMKSQMRPLNDEWWWEMLAQR